MIKEVIMLMQFTTLVPIKKEDLGRIEIGGFTFTINDKEIAFDFDAIGYTPIQNPDGTLTTEYTSGQGVLFNDYDLSKDYFDEYRRQGIDPATLTAQVMANPDQIDEIYIAFMDKCGEYLEAPYIIEYIRFYDENNVFYDVPQSKLDGINSTTNVGRDEVLYVN